MARARHAFVPRAVPLIPYTMASASKSGIRLHFPTTYPALSRSAMLASRCQTLRARTPRTRSEPTGCAAPSARREGSTAATACYRHHSELQTAEANLFLSAPTLGFRQTPTVTWCPTREAPVGGSHHMPEREGLPTEGERPSQSTPDCSAG